MSKYITTYVDKYGNTSIGQFICKCNVEQKENGLIDHIFLEPQSVKERWPSTYYGLYKIPDNLASKYSIGFYTYHSHFKILEELGLTNNLDSNTRIYLENLKTKDNNCHTWYSNGSKVKKGMNGLQQELY